MADTLSAVISGFNFLWDNIRKCYSFAQIYRSHRNILNERATTLAAKKTDVDRRVAEALTRDEVTKEEVKDWILRADRLNHDINDFNNNGGQATSCFFYRCDRIEQLERLTSRIEKILSEPPFESVSDPRPAPRFRRSTTVDNFENVTTEAAVKRVREALRNDGVSVVGVVGTGGVGKTTLVKEVAARVMEDGLYNRVVFVTISKPPNLEKIQKQIAESFSLFLGDRQSRQIRANQIEDRIKREKKVLIVLDDLWGELKLNEVGVPSGNELKSCESKIVLTTRIEHVCHRMKCHEKIRLDTWPELESRDFFKRMAGTEFDSEEFESIADSVADECKGLPIALVAVANTLGDKDKEEWKKALLRLKQSMPPNGDDDGIVYKSVKLSYDFLQVKEQRCFLICCLFPEDHNIEMEELARYVLGMGLFPRKVTVEEARGNTETILKKLMASGLLLNGDKKEQVKMHDVVRDVAIQITSIEDHESSVRENDRLEEKKQVFMVQSGNHPLREWPLMETYESYTAISVMSHDICTLPNGLTCPKLETLLLQDNNNLEEIPSTFFEKMKALRVLDLSGNKASSFPSSIMFLTMLRTLHLDRCMFTDVSALEALQQLTILSLKGSNKVEELPQGIGKLINLRMLDLTSSFSITIRLNVLKGLSCLEELYMRGSFAKWQNENDIETSGNAPIEEVINLRRLIILKVDIADAKCLPQDVKVAPEWWKFDICVCAEARIRWKNIQLTKQNSLNSRNLFLDTSMKNLPDWFITAALEKTEKLTYRNCTELNLVEEHDRGCLAGLKSLVVEDCPDLEEHLMHNPEAGAPICQPVFKGLQELQIHDMYIQNICNVELPEGSLENLKLLEVQQCSSLVNSLLPFNLVKRLLNLEWLRASSISVEEVFGFENQEEGLYLGRLAEMRLLNLYELKNIWKGPARFADFTNLKLVSVIKCSELMNIFSVSVTQGLSNLEDLWVEECYKMKYIIQNEEGITLQSFKLPKLKTLCLENLPILNGFYSGNAVLECPSLEYLHVLECPMFQTLALGINSLNQVKENDEQQMNILRKRMREPEY